MEISTNAQEGREDSCTTALEAGHCRREGGGWKHHHTKGKSTKSNTSPKKGRRQSSLGGATFHLLLLSDVFHLLLGRGAAVSLFLSLTEWWVPPLRVVRLLASSMECVAFHSSSLVDATFPSRSYWAVTLSPFWLLFSPWAALPSLSSFLGGTASLSLQLCSCPKKNDVMYV